MAETIACWFMTAFPPATGSKPMFTWGSRTSSAIRSPATPTRFVRTPIFWKRRRIRSARRWRWHGTEQSLRVRPVRFARTGVHARIRRTFPSTALATHLSLNTYADGTVSIPGTITAGDTITIMITPPGPALGPHYAYTVWSSTRYSVLPTNLWRASCRLGGLINGIGGGTPDPNVHCHGQYCFGNVFWREPDGAHARIDTATISDIRPPPRRLPVRAQRRKTATAAGSTLAGGAAAAELAPGSLVSIFGTNLADTTAAATPSANGDYPTIFQRRGSVLRRHPLADVVRLAHPNQHATSVRGWRRQRRQRDRAYSAQRWNSHRDQRDRRSSRA